MVGGVKRGCLTGKCAVLAYRARTGRAKGLLGATTQGVEPPQPPQRESQSPHRALTGAAMPGSAPHSNAATSRRPPAGGAAGTTTPPSLPSSPSHGRARRAALTSGGGAGPGPSGLR